MLLHMKRTTLILEPVLYTHLKKQAAEERRTFTDVVERTLRLGLRAQEAARRTRVTVPSFDLGPFLVDPATHRARRAPA